MAKYHLLLLAYLSVLMELNAQFTAAPEITSDEAIFSGFSVGVGDINGDLLDDIIVIDQAREVKVAYQNSNHKPFEFGETIYTAPQEIWSIAIADIDNNGRQDILACYFGGATVIYNQYDHFDFIEIVLGGGYLPQSSNLVDIDGDGLLELFICDDNGPNELIKINDGEIEFLDLFDDTDGGIYDGSGNYASLWTDFDLDGDLDLHISKCSAFAPFETNPERINRLYVNDEGVFTNRAQEFGIAFGQQSWSSDFGDVDNDGDLDLFVINHGADNFLYLNEDNVYVDRSDWLDQEDNGTPYQCFFADIDNDTYVDIIVTGTRNYLFYNQGGTGFIKKEGFSNVRHTESSTLGEFNGDGYLDLLAAFPNDFVVPGPVEDLVLLNEGGSKNYLFVNVFGIESNANAIGARLELYGPWGVQLREIRSGVSYGLSTTLSAHFGMGLEDQADSLLIYWPAGGIQKIDSIDANQRLLVYENTCSKTFELAELEPINNFLCGMDTLFIETVDTFLWNDGVLSSIRLIDQPGTYSASNATDGCESSYLQAFRVDDFQGDTTIQVEPRDYGCDGNMITLIAPDGTNYLWNDGIINPVRQVDQTFAYQVVYTDGCGEIQKATASIEFFESEEPIGVDDTIEVAGLANPSAFGEQIIWYSTSDMETEIGRGDTLSIEVRGDSTVFASNRTEFLFDPIIEPVFFPNGGQGAYASSGINGRQYFKINDPLMVNAVSVFVAQSGIRRFVLLDDQDNAIFEQDYDLTIGSNVLNIGVVLEPGREYSLTTDTTTNQISLGGNGPQMLHFKLAEHYPIQRDPRFEFTRANFGNLLFFYFYNWNISTRFVCESEAVPVYIEVTVVSAADDLIQPHDWQLFPNPAQDYLTIDTRESFDGGVIIYDLLGRQRLNLKPGSDLGRVNVDQLEDGIFSVNLYHDGKISEPKLFVKHE